MNSTPFQTAPEFITLDNRRFREISPISPEQMHKKHAALLPASLVQGKTILDLGCCLGATGHWCLSMGAAQYTGIEIQESYATLARSLLERYHPGKATVELGSIEEWLSGAQRQYDVVVILGVLYVFVDYYSILKKVSEIAQETVAVESLYPSLDQFDQNFCGVQFWNLQRINLADENASLAGRGSRLSPAGLSFVMREFGFSAPDGVLYPERIIGSKDLFSHPKESHNARFLMRFTRGQPPVQSLSKDLSDKRSDKKIVW